MNMDSKRLQHFEDVADASCFLAALEFDDESQTGARNHRQLFLGHLQAFALSPDKRAQLFCILYRSHVPNREYFM